MIEKVKRISAAFVVAGGVGVHSEALADGCKSGKASWYNIASSSTRTASGERLDDGANTAAHKTLPFGTRLVVTNKKNGKRVIVKVNDRGPFTGGRVLDLSENAAETIGLKKSGVANVSFCPA